MLLRRYQAPPVYPIRHTLALNLESRMGRPALDVKRVTVNLPRDMPARIDAIVGKQKRSEFVRDALESALRMAEIALKAQARGE